MLTAYPRFPRAIRALSLSFLLAGTVPSVLALGGRDKPRIEDPAPLPGPETRQGHCARQKTPGRAAALARIWGEDPVAAIALASIETGIDFDLMIMKARIESRMGQFDEPLLGGRARGLFHFMPATWLTLFSWFGHEFRNGIYADVAAMIKFDDKKDPYTDNPALTEKILALRSDHEISAFIKGKSIRFDERPLLKAILGREPNFIDYYVAHFLGLDRAKTFFRALRSSPGTAAASIFVRESEDPNNRPLFYRGNKKLSIQQVYHKIGGVVSRTLQRIDQSIVAEKQKEGCMPALILMPKPRQAMEIPPPPAQVEPHTEGQKPDIPPETLPPEGPPVPEPQEPESSMPEYPAQNQSGP